MPIITIVFCGAINCYKECKYSRMLNDFTKINRNINKYIFTGVILLLFFFLYKAQRDFNIPLRLNCSAII